MNGLRCLACEKEGYLVAIDVSEISEVRRQGAVNGKAAIVLTRFSEPAAVDRVFGVLEPDAVLPVPACLRQHGDSLLGVLSWRGKCYFRIAPSLLLDFHQLDLASVRSLTHPSADVPEPTDRLVTFSLAGKGLPEPPLLGVSGRQVLEIRSFEEPIPVPAGSGRLLGLVSWRDSVIPMLDLSLAMGYAPANLHAATRTLILRCSTKSDALALAVTGGISHTAGLNHYRQKTIPESAVQAAIRGAFECSGGELLIPDLDALI